uniref:Carcinustatin-14 n=1 Tax=Carcinus maenas TaxID=6759 RepID=ALL14_CARMA
YSFGL